MLIESKVRFKIIERGVPLVVGFGGGVNSYALLIGLYERGLRPDLITFADTKGEKPETYEALFVIDEWLHSVDFPKLTRCHLVKPIAGDASLEAQCLRLETLPSRAFGNSQCAQRWKIEPQNLVLRTHATTASWIAAGKRVIKALGYDGGEDRRAGIEVDQYCEFWYPLLIDWLWDRDACVAAIKRHGLPVPVKSACFFLSPPRKKAN